MKLKNLLIVCLCTANALSASAQKWLTPQVERQVDELLRQMTVEEKLAYVGGVDWMYTKEIDRLGIHRMKMSDGPQGLGTWGKSTAYPATVMLAATWNEELAYQYGEALGHDCRSKGVNVLLGPAVNIYRAAMCGRNFEYMGEDPYLTSRTVVGYIKGLQDQGVMATVKHFVGNNSEYDRNHISNDMDERTLHEIYLPAFKAAVQEAETGALMTSYNLINGIWTTESPRLLKDILRKQWGYNGLIMSDWGSTHYCVPAVLGGLDLEMAGGEKMNPKDLAYYLKTNVISMDMIDEKVRHILRVLIAFGFKDGVGEDKTIPQDNPQSDAVALKVAQEGIVLLKNEKNILPIDTRKTKHIVVVGKNANGYIRGGGSGNVTPFHYVGTFDGIREAGEDKGINVEYVDELDFMPDLVYTDQNLQERGMRAQYFSNRNFEGTPVLERNEQKVNYSWGNGTAVDGMPKDNYSVRWEGVLCPGKTGEYDLLVGGDDGYRLYIDDVPVVDEWKTGAFRTHSITRTLQAGVKHRLRLEYFQEGGGAAVTLTWQRKGDTQNRFMEYLNKADLIVACFGHNSDTEGEGSDRSFLLPGADAQLMKQLGTCKKPVIGVVNAGGNIGMQDWEPSLKALLWDWYAGQEGGRAVADVLFGDINPSGKLPMTFEKRWEDNPVYNSYYDSDGDKHVAYSEGIFVGYRGYDQLKREVQYPFGYGLSYTTFKLSGLTFSAQHEDGSVDVTCQLANTGKRAGAQVVQAYVGATESSVERPDKELKCFKKVFLKAGETTTVKMTLPKEAFSYYNVNEKQFVTESGGYRIMLGFSSRDIKTEKIFLYR
jgi:beta-glucosidase